jgi:hypothetical protein
MPNDARQDAIALTVQGVGGGIASSSAAEHKTPVTVGGMSLARRAPWLNALRVDTSCSPASPSNWVSVPKAHQPSAADEPRPPASITIYALLATEFFVRYFLDKPVRLAAPAAGTPGSEAPFAKEGLPGADDAAVVHACHGLTRRERLMVGALVFSTLCIFIRCVLPVSIRGLC